jgi:hypothetical protein
VSCTLIHCLTLFNHYPSPSRHPASGIINHFEHFLTIKMLSKIKNLLLEKIRSLKKIYFIYYWSAVDIWKVSCSVGDPDPVKCGPFFGSRSDPLKVLITNQKRPFTHQLFSKCFSANHEKKISELFVITT